MSKSESASWRRVPIQFAIAGALVAGFGGALAGAAIANDESNRTVAPARIDDDHLDRTSTAVQTAQDLRTIVDRMPAGWPATQVMRHAVQQDDGDIAAHVDWQQAVERMPA